MCKVNLITRHRKKERRRRKKHYRVIFDGDRRWLEIVMKSLSRKHLGEKGQKEEAVFFPPCKLNGHKLVQSFARKS
jgi:hypothetical protein